MLFLSSLYQERSLAAQSSKEKEKESGSERAVSEAYSLLASDRFLKPSASDRLIYLQGISKLAAIAHPIDASKSNSKAHPAQSLNKMDAMKLLAQAEADYRKGDVAKGSYLARRVMVICSDCHASQTKPTWTSLSPQSGLSQLEWGEFYKLAHRFDDALLQYEKVLNSPNMASTQSQAWERAALNIVALGVETSSNAYTYVDLISNSLASVQHPKREKALLSSWRTTGKAWGAEPSAVTKPFDMLSQARQFITTGEQMNRTAANTGFVHLTRAMLVLKRVMEKGGPEQKARAYLMAGELREKLPIDGPWLNAEDYYEACGRVAPKSSDALKCYSALQSLPQRNARFVPDINVLKALQPGAK